MTAARKSTSGKSKAPRQRHVWHVSRFEDRFEMPENLRKKRIQPLDFTRDFVASNAGMEAAKYQEQAAQLGNGDGMRQAMLVGLFRKLVNLASNQDRAYRGHLIDAERRPATVGQLAKSLRWPVPELQKAMKELAAAGLMERVTEPNYIEEDKRKFPREASEKPLKQGRRKRTEPNGKDGKSSRTSNGQVPCPEGKRVKGARPSGRLQEQAQAEAEEQERPEPAPVDPKEPEDGQGRNTRTVPGPAPSEKTSMPPAAVPIGHCIKIQDWDADKLGLEVFAALGLETRYSASSKEGKSEWKSFANWLIKAKANAPPSAWPELRERGLRKARHIGKHGRTAKNPGAVWHSIMSGKAKQGKAKTA